MAETTEKKPSARKATGKTTTKTKRATNGATERRQVFQPATAPTRVDYPLLEGEIQRWWDERDILNKYLKRNEKANKRWSFIDGPITANNPMGVHHAWGRSLKDLFQRYHAALGEDERYQNGFDCQGLWVEVEVEKALGLNSKPEIEAYGLDRFARACRDRVALYAGQLTEHSKRLGQWMDWERSYYTMTDPNISYIWGFLKECNDRGWLYSGHRSMPWCPRCGTSLSQHELIDSYKDLTHPSLHVRLPRPGGRVRRGTDQPVAPAGPVDGLGQVVLHDDRRQHQLHLGLPEDLPGAGLAV